MMEMSRSRGFSMHSYFQPPSTVEGAFFGVPGMAR